MPRWRALIGLVAALALVGLPGSAVAQIQALDEALSALTDAGQFDGAVVIRRGDRTRYAKGFGLADAAAGLPFTPTLAVETGSLAKPVTAAAVLLLVSEGALALDASAQSVLPSFPHPDTTVRQLLTHSAGLPDYGAFTALLDAGRPVTTTDLLRTVREQAAAPAFAPGTQFAYCNICYDALAEIVARVSGVSYETFVRERLLGPAGATAAFVRPALLSDWPGVRARGYRRTPTGVVAHDVFDNEGFHGASNIYFSAADVAAWMSAWANGHRALRGIREAATTTVAFADGRSGLTLGNWYCADSAACYYRGHHQGFHAFGYWNARRRVAAAFVSNGAISPRLQVEIPRMLIAAAEGRPVEEATPGTLQLSRTDDALWVTAPGYTRLRAFPIEDWFYTPGLDAYLAPTARGDDLLWRSVFPHAPFGQP